MSYANRSDSRRLSQTSERTAREMFFAMLGASSLCLLFGLVAVGGLAL